MAHRAKTRFMLEARYGSGGKWFLFNLTDRERLEQPARCSPSSRGGAPAAPSRAQPPPASGTRWRVLRIEVVS